MLPAEVRKTKLVPQKQTQIYIAEAPEPLNAYTAHVDRGPRRRLFPRIKQTRRRTGLPRKDPTDLFPANPLFSIKPRKFANGSNNPLTGAKSGPD